MSKIKTATSGMLLAAGLVVFGWTMIAVGFGFVFGSAVTFFMIGIPSVALGILGYEIERRGL